MKRINIISKIILLFQLVIALKYATLFGDFLDIFEFLHNIISDAFAMRFGFVAVPAALLAVGIEAVHKKHYGTNKKIKQYKFVCVIHIILGLWNFFVGSALSNI